MEKQTLYLIWIPVVFGILVLYSFTTIPVDNIEFTGELIDKYIDKGTHMYFVVKNDTIKRTNVDIDLYYSHEIGDIVTVEYKDSGPNLGDEFFLSMGYMACFMASVIILMFIDHYFYEKNYEKNEREHSENEGD